MNVYVCVEKLFVFVKQNSMNNNRMQCKGKKETGTCDRSREQ